MKRNVFKTIVKFIILTISLAFVGLILNGKISVKAEGGTSYTVNNITYNVDLNTSLPVTGVLTTGNYYLSNNLELASGQSIIIKYGEVVNIYLNGFMVGEKIEDGGFCVPMIENAGTLSIFDDSTKTNRIYNAYDLTGRYTDDGYTKKVSSGYDTEYDSFSTTSDSHLDVTGGGFVGGIAVNGAFMINTGILEMNGGFVAGFKEAAAHGGTSIFAQKGTATIKNVKFIGNYLYYNSVIYGSLGSTTIFDGNNTLVNNKTQGSTICYKSNGSTVFNRNFAGCFLLSGNSSTKTGYSEFDMDGITENDIHYYSGAADCRDIYYSDTVDRASSIQYKLKDSQTYSETRSSGVGVYDVKLTTSSGVSTEIKDCITITGSKKTYNNIEFSREFANLPYNGVLSSGNYYLTKDYALKNGVSITVKAGSTVNIFLDGYVIYRETTNGTMAPMVVNGGILNIYSGTAKPHTIEDIYAVGVNNSNVSYIDSTDGLYDKVTQEETTTFYSGFLGGIASDGAVIKNLSGAAFTMKNGSIISGYATGQNNMGVVNNGGTAIFENVAFLKNLSESSPIIHDGGNITLTGCSFEENSVVQSSIIFVEKDAYVVFSGVTTFFSNLMNNYTIRFVESNGVVYMSSKYDSAHFVSTANTNVCVDDGLVVTDINVGGLTEEDIKYYEEEYSKDGVTYEISETLVQNVFYVQSSDPTSLSTIAPKDADIYDVYLFSKTEAILVVGSSIKITKKTVSVDWCEDDFEYNGEYQSSQVTASIKGVDNINYALKVTLDGTFKYTKSYSAQASFETPEYYNTNYSNDITKNYILDTSTINKTYTIKPHEIEIDWTVEYTYNGSVQTATAKYLDVEGVSHDLSVEVDKEFKEAGYYTGTVTTVISDINYTLPINKTRTLHINPMQVSIKWTSEYLYTGQEITGVAYYETLDKVKMPLIVKFDDGIVFKNANTYTAHAEIDPNNKNDNYTLPANPAQTLTITPKVIDIVWCEDNFVYNGEIQTVTASYVSLETGENVALTVSISNLFKNAGTYTCTAKFTKADSNYSLPDVVTKVYTLQKARVSEPTIDGTYVYTSEEQTVTLTGYDSSYMIIVDSIKETNAGDYPIRFILDTNHEWKDGADGKIIWTINKATFNTANTKWEYTGPRQFNGFNIEINVTGIPDGVTIVKYTNNKKYNVGVYTATVEIDYDRKNYNELIIPALEWEIKQAENEITIASESFSVVYSGEKVEVPFAESLFGVVSCNYRSSDLVNAGVYNVVYTVEESDNYKGVTKEITITISPKPVKEPFVNGTYKYNGLVQQADVKGFNSKYMSTSDEITGKEAGTYKIHFELDPNYTWQDGSDGDVYWEIRKATFGSTETGIRDKSQIAITCSDGVSGDITMNSGFVSEEEVENYQSIVDYSKLPEDVKLAANEKVSAIYKIELYKTVNGVEVALQPGDISVTGKITVKLLIPVDVDPDDIRRIVHVHSADNIKSISLDDVRILDGYLIFEVTELSEFALITNQSFVSTKTFMYIIIGSVAILVIALATILINRAKNKKAEAERNAGNRYYVDKRKKK